MWAHATHDFVDFLSSPPSRNYTVWLSVLVTELGTAKEGAGMFGTVFQLASAVGKVLGESVCIGRCLVSRDSQECTRNLGRKTLLP